MTAGDPYGEPYAEASLGALSNHCLIELGLLAAYVPSNVHGFKTDSRGYFPNQQPIYFLDDFGAQICDHTDLESLTNWTDWPLDEHD